jgi:hypothetical protein
MSGYKVMGLLPNVKALTLLNIFIPKLSALGAARDDNLLFLDYCKCFEQYFRSSSRAS